MLSASELAFAAVAALAAGAVNALAGGGTLLSFPALIALGLPPLTANVTNTVALVPGYLGGTWACRSDLDGQRRRIRVFVPVAALGGVIGGVLLLVSPDRVFDLLVPVLILGAVVILALGDRVSQRVAAAVSRRASGREHLALPALGILGAAIYGGYFGGGLGIIVLAVLGAVVVDGLHRINALKQLVSLSANGSAALLFVFSDRIVWSVALVMLVGAVVGGFLGGRLAGRLPVRYLRRLVLAIGVIVAVVYVVRL